MKQADSSHPATFRFAQWRVLLALMFCYLFYYLGRHNYGWAFPYLEAELGLTYKQLGVFSMVLLLSYGIGQFINGNLGDKFGGRKMMTMGGLFSVVFNWITGLATSFYSLLIPWAANGYAQAMGWAPGSRMLSNWWHHSERGKAFGFFVFSAGCSGVLVFAICGGINMLVRPAPIDVRLVSVETHAELPAQATGVVYVARDAQGLLHFRIFENDGELLADTPETAPDLQAERLEKLRKTLDGLWERDELTPAQEGRIVREVTALVGVVRTGILSWRAFFQLPVLLLAGGCIVFYIVARNKPEDQGFAPIPEEREEDKPVAPGTVETSLQRYGMVVRNWRFVLATFSIGFESLARYGLIVWLPTHLIRHEAYEGLGFWIGMSLPVGMALGALCTGFISDKLFASNRSRPIALLLVLAAVVLLLFYMLPPERLVLGMVLLFLAGFLVYGPQSCYWALCPDLLGRYRAATAIGVMNMWAYFVAATTDPLIGWVVDLYGTTPIFALLAISCGLGAVLILPVRR
jgi:sugar phosphate permease